MDNQAWLIDFEEVLEKTEWIFVLKYMKSW